MPFDLGFFIRVGGVRRARHARGVGRIRRGGDGRVMFLLFAPQGSGEAESLTPLKRRTTFLSNAASMRVLAFGSRMGVLLSWTAVIDRCCCLSASARRFDRRNEMDKIVKLPCRAGHAAGWWERPILENSTACTCQMPNNLVGHFLIV